MLTPGQATQLAEAGLDYYNHNIDTSPERYEEVITTRTFADRLQTLENVRNAGINVCSGGIVGMGETRADRVGFVHALATLEQHPESVPVNALVPVKGTVLGDMLELGPYERHGHELVGVRAAEVAQLLITVGPRGALIAEAARSAGLPARAIHRVETVAEATELLRGILHEGDVALVKGSHGLRMDRIVSALEAAE